MKLYRTAFLSIFMMTLTGIANAQAADLPPIVVPPPKVGDPIGTQPPKVDPKMVIPKQDTAAVPPAGSTKLFRDKIFCSNVSADDAMKLCQEWSLKNGGSCQTEEATKSCSFRSKVLAGGLTKSPAK